MKKTQNTNQELQGITAAAPPVARK